ncbi:MAG TPA: M23 family metallopeptidase [bacterium]|nr:M23 family metallopeptidase [bacterium]
MKLLFIDQESGIKEFKITKFRISAAVILIGVMICAFVYFTFIPLTKSMYDWKIAKIKGTNDQLVQMVRNMQNRVNQAEQYLLSIGYNDEAVRTYVGMKGISQDVRKLGIGGTRYDKTTELDYLLPEKNTKISEILIGMDRLERMVKLERFSYNELDSTYQYTLDKIEATPSIRPLHIGYFTDGYGWRNDPFTGERRFHNGLDISAPTGTPVYAGSDGIVKYAKRRGGYGMVVSLSHTHGFETVYAHLSKMLVKPGQRVRRGEKIAEVGNTGRSTASHLHYEVRTGGEPVDPLNYFFSGYLQ